MHILQRRQEEFMAETADVHRWRRALVQKLESLHRSGIRELPQSQVVIDRNVESSRSATRPPTAVPPVRSPHVDSPAAIESRGQQSDRSPGLPSAVRAEALQLLSNEVGNCVLCSELCETRTQTVFGVGNPNARLVFLGEAPGADEDRVGEPFVGRAGQLLTKIIEACTLSRDDVYIMNVLKCRPPANRNPTPEEAARCRPFFEKQLEIIQPDLICCLGAIAAKTLIDTSDPIGRLRGKFYE